jgi:hypothetical protein
MIEIRTFERGVDLLVERGVGFGTERFLERVVGL